MSGIGSLLIVATFLLPFLFFFYVYRTQRHAMPLLGLIAVLANGVWWFAPVVIVFHAEPTESANETPLSSQRLGRPLERRTT